MARKILLADDSVTAQNMGRKILADAGYEVTTVNNGSAALKKIGEQRPDLIVLDVYMPGYSGLEVCQRLKEVGDTARIPILLTVGKLEPFKTDEAKRVRADGYIVKPFEASELLSALSKLEDKIVPRSEGSKGGRFARASAAIDETRDRTVAGDEDSGWKNRIAFPSKKKQPEPEVEADDPAIYNPVNKDLRTVVEHHQEPEKAQPEHVDVGALAPEGLPKDVTPEEIAALAAAAAQVQGKILEMKSEKQKDEVSEQPETAKADAVTTAEQTVETTVETKAEASATFAEQHSAAATETSEAVAKQDVSSSAATGTAQPVASVPAAEHVSEEAVSEPITIAVAAGTGSSHVSRWTAVAVALAPEESGIALEEEMRQAYASFAKAEPSASTIAPLPEAPAEEPAVDPSPVSTVAAVPSEALDVPAPSVKQFETVAAPESAAQSSESLESKAHVETAADVTQESPAAHSDQPEPAPVEATQAPVAESASSTPATETHPEEATATSEPDSPVEAIEPEAQPAAVDSVAKHDLAAVNNESEIANTTAAAWASWRKIRETGDGHPSHPEQNDSTATDHAAMAVAAGAEKSASDSDLSAESDPAIASIVDSVLADLRPKIVEEISRKLGKKK